MSFPYCCNTSLRAMTQTGTFVSLWLDLFVKGTTTSNIKGKQIRIAKLLVCSGLFANVLMCKSSPLYSHSHEQQHVCFLCRSHPCGSGQVYVLIWMVFSQMSYINILAVQII